uniref:Uncharacterized protein n=1 Tax=uncultured bacterium A1Q1_fos_2067 TaxID=1256560 RepID=L7VUG2_9BACT|nr:hypothetical protein [uncultured bacterium A1Q1_fos_2067]
MLQRLLYPWHLPPYGITNTESFDWNPKNLEPQSFTLPEPVKGLVEGVQWEWMFDFSCAVARQLSQVGVTLADNPPANGAVFIANDQNRVSPQASAHAYLMTLAQRSAIEMVGLMRESAPQESAGHSCPEITGVAFFAECAAKRGTGARLSETLQILAQEVTARCNAEAGGDVRIQFSHTRPTQAKSPIANCGTLPVAGYRIRYSGCETDQVLQALADAIQSLPPPQRVAKRADIMVLSNLWCRSAV